ncbi:MAG TPA: hypothetical protein VKB37_08555 [Jatrophihabitantaceae bacterium]|nr:hypothetical protein [Jatrophihabitantaceae bacterium]
MQPHRPRDLSELELGFARQRAVRWLSPRVLVSTGIRALLASIFGSYSDKRELQAVLPGLLYRHDEDDELWFDFVADLGDGFDATYSVASLLAAPSVDVGLRLPRGRVLILGGDEVYPTASARSYEDRMKGPYRAALPERPLLGPTMFALPGNHDWYDGLTAFLRLFTQGRPIGGWATRQTRSYFAIALPQRWWLFAVDAQLTSYIDEPQLAYFRGAATELRPGDGVILCWPTPAWAHRNPEDYDPIDFFDRDIIRPTGASIRVMLSGDYHHYARYSSDDGSERITCGTGGAYLVATHRLRETITAPSPRSRMRDQTEPRTFQLRARYPDRFASRWLTPGILGLGWRNPGFVALLGAVQAVFVISLVFAIDYGRRLGGGWSSLQTLRASLPTLLLALLILCGAVGFARIDPRSPRVSALIAGFAHGLAQLGLGIGWTASVFALHHYRPDWLPDAALALIVAVVTVPIIGAVATLVTGAYLALASQFDVNLNEAFAGQSIEDYKGFLRMRITPSGQLSIYPIKVARICRSWQADPDGIADDPWLLPLDPLRTELIEEPITVARC